jgi:hypothetical protein
MPLQCGDDTSRSPFEILKLLHTSSPGKCE